MERQYIGEILALTVAILWTMSSLASEYASKRFGSLLLNIFRMALTIVAIGGTLWVLTGSPLPSGADGRVWLYLALSALSGYIIGDYFFLKCFILIGARWGELFMTVAPIAAAVTGWIMLGEKMSSLAIAGMCITIAGIGMSVMSRKEEDGKKKMEVKLPLKGIIYGLIAGVGQGVGLVLSKQGMLIFSSNISAEGSTTAAFTTPFAATMIRCIVALAGFATMYAVGRISKTEDHKMSLLLQDGKAVGWAVVSTLAGPCVGVALSLAATMYTATGITQTIMALVPVLILWPSHLFFHTKITVPEIIGACISVVGVAMFFV